ncbi:MAG: class I SAM-dependent methyltransferase [Myxococcota bacterium]
MNDFGRRAADYARHRAGFPEELYDRLQRLGLLRADQRAVDLGTGTGTLARGLARRGLEVVGVDISVPLLTEARRLADESALSVRFVEAAAEETSLSANAFDLITAGQCWHWFDRPRAAHECRRLLLPGGRLVIVHLDWLPFDGNVVDVTVQTILDFGARFSDRLVHAHEGMYPEWTNDARRAGLVDIETFSFDIDLPYRKADWQGRIRASAPIGGSLTPEDVERFDALHAERLTPFADELTVPHRVWAMMATQPEPT